MSPTAQMSEGRAFHAEAQRARRNARRISTVAEGEQNWRRMLCWSESGTRTGCSYSSYNVS